jgi:benzoate membrane transport protein
MFGRLPPVPAWTSAVIATVIGFGGTVALITQAMRTLGASVEQTGSAVTALCLGIGVSGAIFSVWLRMPVVTAWSTPGAALLAATTPALTWAQAVGAFLAAAAMMIVVGLVPLFETLAKRIPSSIAAAMLAGVLLPFCLNLFKLGTTEPLLILVLGATFVVARQHVPLYALLLVLAVGVVFTALRGAVQPLPQGATFGTLIPAAPNFDARIILSLGVPLFLVTLVAQNLPGLVVLSASGYHPNPGPLLWGTGLASLLMAPFGAHGVNLAAITAAICTNEEAHPDRTKRWTVGVLYALCYLLLAVFSPLLVRLFFALPNAVIVALTGIALIPALTSATSSMLTTTTERDAAIVTFLATGSGMTLFGLGSAFWGLVAGLSALGVRSLVRRPSTRPG